MRFVRRLAVLAIALAAPHFAVADDAPLRPSARLLFKAPELLRAGECVRYEEGGAGWVATDPVYFLKGEVVSADVQTRHLGRCPAVPGKTLERYSRAEFVRHARAYPCVSGASQERDEQIGIVKIRVQEWETPHARRAENSGRLYRGMFLDQPLQKGMEIELEADLLGLCGT